MPKSKSSYTTKQKLEALKLVEQNGLRATERQLGITRRTLSQWKKDYKILKAENEEEQEVVKQTGEVLYSTKEDLLEQHMIEFIPEAIKFKEEALKKMKELARKSTNPEHLHYVAGAFKIVHESMTPKGAQINIDNSKTQNVANIFQAVEDVYKDKLK